MIFDPEAYPLNSGMLTGKITLKELKEKHFKEYERLKAKGLIRDTEEKEE
jgi:hypothetical protein